MRIYVASPYTAPTPAEVETNVNRACEVGVALVEQGHTVFVPVLSHYLHKIRPQPYRRWMEMDLEWLRLCDALLLIAPSPGACREVKAALGIGITCFRLLGDCAIGEPIEVYEECLPCCDSCGSLCERWCEGCRRPACFDDKCLDRGQIDLDGNANCAVCLREMCMPVRAHTFSMVCVECGGAECHEIPF